MNLRGDAHEQIRQKQFCSLTSSILLIFTELEENWKEVNELLTMSAASHFIVLSSSTNKNIRIPSGKKVKIISSKSLSELDVSRITFKSLLEVITKCTISKPLVEQINFCKGLKIRTDEEAPFCITAKLIANEISTNVRKIFTEWSIKSVFPLIMMKKDWIEFRDTGREVHRAEDVISIFQAEKTLRENQRKQILSEETMRTVSAILEDENVGVFLMFWLEMLSNEMEQCYIKSNLIAQMTSGVRSQVEHTLQWRTRLDNRGMFLEELQQIVESSKSVSTEANSNKSFPEHSRIFAKLLLNGHSLHITDGNFYLLSTTWIRKVFKDLHEMTGGKGVKVVSILGECKSGKSKLFNKMFGVDFPEGFEKRTVGLQMHLVPAKSCSKTMTPFGFFLLIDTEGLTLEAKGDNFYRSRNFFVSIMATALSDITVVHTCSKQSFCDMHGVISIITKSVEHIGETGQFPKIYFIHQKESGQMLESEEKANKGQGQSEGDGLDISVDYSNEENTESFFLWDDLHAMDKLKFTETLSNMTSGTGVSLSNLSITLIQLIANTEEVVLLFDEFGEKIVETFQIVRFIIDIYSVSSNVSSPLQKLYELLKEMRISVQELTDNACKLMKDAPYDRVHGILDENLSAMTVLHRRNMLAVGQTFKDLFLLEKPNVNISYKELALAIIEDMKSANESTIKSFRRKMVEIKKTRREEILAKLRIKHRLMDEEHGSLIEDEIDNFIVEFTSNMTRHDWNDLSERSYKEKWNMFMVKIKEKYPIIELHQQEKLTKLQLISFLENLGYDLQEIAVSKSFHDCASAYHISTEEDLFKAHENFNVVSNENEKLMQNLFLKIEALCKNEMDFSIRTETAVDLFRRFDEESDLPVDRATLFTFLCSQYISKTHTTHFEEDSRMTEISQPNGKLPGTGVNLDSHKQCDKPKAEFLQFTNLNSKIENVLLQVKTFLTEEEFFVVKQSMSEQTVQNYTHIPFNCSTLQRLDVYFHSLLPVLSKYDMETINSVVDDAKMFILGKVLAKANLDLSRELNNMFASIEKDLKKHNERTAVVFHISSWSVPLFSFKLRRDKEEQGTARSIERLADVTFAKFLSNMNLASDVLLADILCEEVEHSLLRFIEDSWVKQFTEIVFTLQRKFKWKETVIRRMLCTFCKQHDFENLVDLIFNYGHVGTRKLIKLIADIVNEKRNSLIHNIAENILRGKIKQCISALEETTELFQTQEGSSVEVWLNIFVDKMSQYSIHFLREKHLDILKKCTKVSNFANFTKQCDRKVLELRSRVKSLLHLPPAGNTDYTVTWLYEMPDEIYMTFIRDIKGCTNQCPLCGAICEHGLESHDFHHTPHHYPMCFKGRKYETVTDTWTLDTTSCSNETINRHQEKLKEWKITQDTTEPMIFWKYMVHAFSSQLLQFHKCDAIDIPPAWHKVSQSDALKSMNGGISVTE